MNEIELRELLEQVKAGNIGPDDALNSLRRLPFADLGHARIDHHRSLRTGAPEAIYGPNKSPEHCVSIVAELLDNGTGPVLLTRANDEQIDAVLKAHDDANLALIHISTPTRLSRIPYADFCMKKIKRLFVPENVHMFSLALYRFHPNATK